jgi:hypothetical protein
LNFKYPENVNSSQLTALQAGSHHAHSAVYIAAAAVAAVVVAVGGGGDKH